MALKFQEKDGGVKVEVDLKAYPLQSVHSSGYVFMDRAHVVLEEEKKDLIAVWLKPKKAGQDLQQLALDFSDELLNYAHYFSSLQANADNMKTLLQRALFSASPSIVKEAEEKEIEDLIKELEAEERQEVKAKPRSKPASKKNK